MITQQELLERFEYRDGKLCRQLKTGLKAMGTLTAYGYIQARINNKSYLVHRLIFLMHHGYLPKQVDHINNDKTDNRIENLRESTQSENMFNVKINKLNTSGVKNVYWHKRAKSWCVRVKVEAKEKYIGLFKDLEAAELAAHLAREKYHGEFARHI